LYHLNPLATADLDGSWTVSYSDIRGGHTGTGPCEGTNCNIDPNLLNYHLQLTSDNNIRNGGTSDGAPTVDLDGRPRDESPGMGAFEYTGDTGDVLYIKPTPTGDEDCSSWEDACSLTNAINTLLRTMISCGYRVEHTI